MKRRKDKISHSYEILMVILILWSAVVLTNPLQAREKTKQYTVNDGLSQQSVTAIIQDKNDMLWIGTFDGLNQFDGKSFTTFRHHPGDSTSIINNRVISLAENKEDGLWILFSSNHVAQYLGKGKFRNFNLTEDMNDWGNSIKTMIICDHNLIISGLDKQTFIFNPYNTPDSERIRSLKNFIELSAKKEEYIISTDFSKNELWISTNKGIYHLNAKNEINRIKNYRGFSLKMTDNGDIILWKNGTLKICNPIYNGDKTDNLHEVGTYNLSSNIQSVASCIDNNIWIGTNKALYKTNGAGVELYLPNFPSRVLFNDNLGLTWSGGMNGLTAISPYAQPVDNFCPSKNDFSISNHIDCINISPDESEVWVSPKSNGIYRLEWKKDAEGERSVSRAEHLLEQKKISALEFYSRDTLVFVEKTNLNMLIRQKNGFRIENIRNKIFENAQPISTIKIGDMILLASDHQIIRLSFKNRRPILDSLPEINRKLPDRSIIFSMAEAPDDTTFWVGFRGDGAYRICLKNNSVENLETLTGIKLTSNYVWDIYFDSKDRLCLGTDAGLNIIGENPEEKGKIFLRTLTTDNGVKNDKIVSIQEDKENNLWLGTSQGIICYNIIDGKVQTYDNEDGFRSNNFTSCSKRMQDGTLLFGSSNGMSYFNPLYFKKHTITPSMHISSIRTGKEEVEQKDWNNFVMKGNDVAFKLKSYYPINPNKIKYRYSVNGNAWNEITGNQIILSDLSPNTYQISICCVNEKNVSSPISTVRFRVKRHPLFSITAQIIYTLLIITVGTIFIRAKLYQKMMDNKLKMEEELHVRENKMNSEKMNFYTNMAHEIKTPLSLILGRVYDIEQSGEASPYIVRKAKLIGDNAQIIKELTEQILEFKRAISGKLDLQIQEQDIMPCIIGIIDNYKDYAEKKGIKIDLESSSESIVKYIDQKKVTRIIYNLLSNAIKFSERDDTISIKITGKEDSLVLTVSDTGQGIDSKDLPHIFERFYKSGKAGGSGIGLAFTKSLVELMNGTITVNSTYGSGTVFQVTIPDAEHSSTAAAPEKNVAAKKEESLPTVSFSSTPDILLVEDNVDLNEYITEILSTRFNVHQCYNGKEALATLKNKKIDLVLTDIMMNDINGIELAHKIKNSKSISHIPIVFLSAKSDPDDMLEGFQTGAVDYITKPFNPHMLLIKIQNILTQYFLSRATFMEGKTQMKESPTVQNRDEIFINKARDIIYKNMAEETFGVNALSEEMGISRVHLTREFQRITEKSPSTFIKSIRLNHAKHLLSTGEYSIKEVLWEIGIRSHSGFTKAFKEEFGYLPSQISNNNTKTISDED